MTYMEMCKTIEKAAILTRRDGSKPTANEIWNYSPSGEIYMLHVWYGIAVAALSTKEEASCSPSS